MPCESAVCVPHAGQEPVRDGLIAMLLCLPVGAAQSLRGIEHSLFEYLSYALSCGDNTRFGKAVREIQRLALPPFGDREVGLRHVSGIFRSWSNADFREDDVRAACGWLLGSGGLRFSDNSTGPLLAKMLSGAALDANSICCVMNFTSGSEIGRQ